MPDFIEMAKTFDMLKKYMLDSDSPEVRKAKEEARVAAMKAKHAKSSAP